MIIRTPRKIRPVFTYQDNHWKRKDIPLECDGHSIRMSGFFISEDQLVNLTSELGVVSYGTVIDNVPMVFDFSAMHLCACQLKRVRMLLNENVFQRNAS